MRNFNKIKCSVMYFPLNSKYFTQPAYVKPNLKWVFECGVCQLAAFRKYVSLKSKASRNYRVRDTNSENNTLPG